MPSEQLGLGYRVLLAIARVQPFNRGLIRRFWINFFKKRVNHPVLTSFRGVPFLFNLDNSTEQKGLFNFYNLDEVKFVTGVAHLDNPVFIDIGANSGFYSQIFLYHATAGAQVLAIEPNPQMCERISRNASLIADRIRQGNHSLTIENCAVGAAQGIMHLNLELGVGGAHIINKPSSNSIEVKINTLQDVLAARHIHRIDLLKIDVEGYEDRVLIPFFDQADRSLFPRNLLIEHTSDQDWTADLWDRLDQAGYKEVFRTRGNVVLRLT